MFRLVVLSLAVLLVSSASATNVKQCSNGEPFPLSVDIEGCDEPPCDAIKGTTAVMDVHFVSTKNDVRNLTAVVRATTLGFTVNYDLPENVADVCGNLLYDAICPVYASEDVTYRFNFYLDQYYPEISVKVEVSLVDEEQESMACFVVDIKVKKGPVSS